MNKKNNALNLILIMLTGMLVPMLSHLLDCISGNNSWDTERIMILYFTVFSSMLLVDAVILFLKDSGLFEKGIRLGDSDALKAVCTVSISSLVIMNYDDIYGTVIILIVGLAGIFSLWKNMERMEITPSYCVAIGLITIIIAYTCEKINLRVGAGITQIKFIFILIIAQLLVCGIFDFIKWIRKNKKRNKSR